VKEFFNHNKNELKIHAHTLDHSTTGSPSMCIMFMYGSVQLRLRELDHPITPGIGSIGCAIASGGVHKVKPCPWRLLVGVPSMLLERTSSAPLGVAFLGLPGAATSRSPKGNGELQPTAEQTMAGPPKRAHTQNITLNFIDRLLSQHKDSVTVP